MGERSKLRVTVKPYTLQKGQKRFSFQIFVKTVVIGKLRKKPFYFSVLINVMFYGL